MNNKKVARIFRIASILPLIISICIFYTLRGPNNNISFIITLYVYLSTIGMLFSVLAWKLEQRFSLLVIGLLGNGTVLVIAFFLQLALGIGEP